MDRVENRVRRFVRDDVGTQACKYEAAREVGALHLLRRIKVAKEKGNFLPVVVRVRVAQRVRVDAQSGHERRPIITLGWRRATRCRPVWSPDYPSPERLLEVANRL